VGYENYPDRMPNTRLWFDNAIGGWE